MAILPETKRKVGTTLYSCQGYIDGDKAVSEIWEWEIVSVKRPRRTKSEIEANISFPLMLTAHAKRSNTYKKGKWSKAVLIEHAEIYTKTWVISAELPIGLSTTPLRAIQEEILLTKDMIKDLEADDDSEIAEIEDEKRIIAALKNRVKRKNYKISY
tara:strand:- start:215 stop:685 length:471 start_codon:yes stop_codon:yes gene_type:complete